MCPGSQAAVPGVAGPVRGQAPRGGFQPAVANRALQPASGAGAASASWKRYLAPLAVERPSR
jgi:hypothetical protein